VAFSAGGDASGKSPDAICGSPSGAA